MMSLELFMSLFLGSACALPVILHILKAIKIKIEVAFNDK
jgi:hypothetical protein